MAGLHELCAGVSSLVIKLMVKQSCIIDAIAYASDCVTLMTRSLASGRRQFVTAAGLFGGEAMTKDSIYDYEVKV